MPDDHGFYLAGPSGPERAGVLVIHDWYGLPPHVRAACDQLAAAGLLALAPDLYDGRTATDPAQAEALMEGLDQAAARARLDEAVATVRARAGGGPVGVLGWSMGGSFTDLAGAASG
jgi:carboxymethylenebutenolidase